MKYTTAHSLDGKEPRQTLGLVHGQALVSINFAQGGGGINPLALMQALYASATVTSAPGGLRVKKPPMPIGAALPSSGRSAQFKPLDMKSISKALEKALQDMGKEATAKGADAVIGVQIAYQSIATGDLLIAVTGTAIKR